MEPSQSRLDANATHAKAAVNPASEPSQLPHKQPKEGKVEAPPPLSAAAPQDTSSRRPKERPKPHATHKRRSVHSERATGLTSSPLGIALCAAWLLTVFLTFSFDVVVDVFQRYLTLRDPPVVPWLLLVCANAGVHLALMFIVVLLGRLTKRRFRYFQPFVGGDAFVILQLAGYAAVYVTAVVRAVLLSQRQERYGVYVVLSMFAVVGHSLLLWSLSFFQPPHALTPSTLAASVGATARRRSSSSPGVPPHTEALSGSMAHGWRERLASSPLREIAWIVLCGGLVIFSSTVAEYHPSYRVANVVVIICFVAASLLTIQYVVVPQWLAHHFYHVFLPVVLQSPSMYVMQLFGNGLLLMTFYAELVLFNAQQDAPRSWHLGSGLMSVLAIGAHLLLVHQLHAWVVEEDEVAAKKRAESAASALSRETGNQSVGSSAANVSRPPSVVLGSSSASGGGGRSAHQEGFSAPLPVSSAASTSQLPMLRAEYQKEIGSYGPVLPSLFSILLCVILIGILYVSLTSGDSLSAYVRQGLLQTEALLVTLLFVQPLITHLMGVFLYGKDYHIWQPFEGNIDFILLQCVGWFCYGVAIFCGTLHLNEHGHDNFLLFLMAFIVLSQFFIHMSVVRFGRGGPKLQMCASSAFFVAEASGEAGGAAGAASVARGEDPLSHDRPGSRSPARSDATSEEPSSYQRTPQWDRSSSADVDHSPSLAGPLMSENGTGLSGGGVLLPALSCTSAFGTSTEASFDHAADPTPFTSGAYTSDATNGASSLLSSVLNGELLLSLVLMAVSLVLRVVVIAAAYIQHFAAEKTERGSAIAAKLSASSSSPSTRLSAAKIPIAAIVVAATIFSMTATPVVQWSMRHRARLLHPKSYAYVALATLGWGTYLLLLSRFMVLWGLLGMDRVSVTSPITRVGLSCFLPSSEFSSWLRQSCDAATVDAQGQYSTGETLTLTAAFEGAVEGFVWCFPFLCLLAGNLFQTHAFIREASAQERVQRAVASILRLFHEQAALANSPRATASPLHASSGLDARLTHLLRAAVGTRMAAATRGENASAESDSSRNNANGSTTSADPADLKAVHDAARYMTFTLCAATSAAFFSAAFLADAQPIMTLGFGAVGTVTLGLSCVALHYIYGTRVHDGTRAVSDAQFAPRAPVYTFFMPFVGGARFVALQSMGWISFTSVLSLMIACALEGKGTAAIFVIMAVLSMVAQVALLRSVGCFDESKVVQRGFLQRNAEGFLAAISVVATVSFCRLYDMAAQGRATAHVFSSLVPAMVCSVAVCLAVPLGLMSLQRQAELYGLGSLAAWFASEEEDGDGDDGGIDDQTELETSAEEGNMAGSHQHSRGASTWTEASDSAASSPLMGSVSSPGMPHSIYSRANTEGPFSPLLGTPGVVRGRTWASVAKRGGSSTRRRSQAAVILYLLSTVLAMVVIVVLPFALVFMGYAYYTQRATVTYGLAVRAVEALLCCFTALVVLPMLVVPVLGRSSILRNVHSALCCWALYNIPTYTFLGGISTPFIYNCRGTFLFTVNMCSMALLSNLPYMPVAMSIFSICSFVYFLKYHFYDGVYIHKHALEPVQCVVDLVIAVFWLWYQRRYHGRPEITARLQSRRATRFFQRYFFRGLCYYFSMRVIVGDGYVLPQEEPFVSDASELPRVNLSKPENQYMFSFHPHGVFPGTSMVAPKTEIWEAAVGSCKEHFVSTHCADIVFNVPLMREFPMCLGAMSVSRRGIESSLKHGNSPLIVTGGQSEMLLTRLSDREMHVVCHHTGFVRIAIMNRVPLVPVISFSESNILDNLHCIRLQRWFLKRIAFPFPTMPIGRCYLPLPTTKPVTIVIGQPISPLPGRDNPDDPTHVEELRLRYFEHLEVLFYKYRAEAGYPTMDLYLHNGIYNPGVCGTPSVTTPLTKGSKERQGKAGLSVEMFDSAVRRAFAMAPDEVHGPTAKTQATPPPAAEAATKEK